MSGVGITARGVSMRLPDGRAILRDIGLEIHPGEVHSILGLSGSGKTTLLKCIGALLRPTSGTICIGDEDIAAMDETALNRIRRRIGFVFQYAALFDSMTVFENIAFGIRQHRTVAERHIPEVVRQRLHEVNLEGVEEQYPSELSGGMRKRVGMARALAMDPDILCYDEPTSGLDPVIGRAIDDLIVATRDARGVTSVVVSHDIGAALRISNRMTMIDDGAVVMTGLPEEFLQAADPRVCRFMEEIAPLRTGYETPDLRSAQTLRAGP